MKAEAWDVRWCYEMPTDECGDADLDNGKYRRRRFPTEALAMAYANEVLPDDFFGAVSVRPVARVSWQQVEDDANGDGDLEWWQEGREAWAIVGEEVEVS